MEQIEITMSLGIKFKQCYPFAQLTKMQKKLKMDTLVVDIILRNQFFKNCKAELANAAASDLTTKHKIACAGHYCYRLRPSSP